MAESRYAVGSTVGRYRIEKLIGVGGMGEVYLAWDAQLARQLVLKVVKGEQSTDRRQRLLREARAAAGLNHPAIVTVFDIGEVDDELFVAMEYVEGTTLRDEIGRATATLATRLRWLMDIARALEAAHRAGIVHRDIKPENVMVSSDGQVKVLDFGLARTFRGLDVSDDDSALTAEGAIVGTPFYMAPEQMLAEPLDARCDQFSWAVVAYELLCGERPWGRARNLVAALQAIRSERVVPPSAHLASLPEPLDAAILRALSPQPSERYDSMAALLAALPRELNETDITGPGVSRVATADTELAGTLSSLQLALAVQIPPGVDAALREPILDELVAALLEREARALSRSDDGFVVTFVAEDALAAVSLALRATDELFEVAQELSGSLTPTRGWAPTAAIALLELDDGDGGARALELCSASDGVLIDDALFAHVESLGLGATRFPEVGAHLLSFRTVVRQSGVGELVGRASALRTLDACEERLLGGSGQIVAIVGGAGIGKTRLKREFRRRISTACGWFEGHCTARSQLRGYAPFVSIARDVFDIGSDDSSRVARTKVRAGLHALVGGSQPAVTGAFEHLLGIEREPGRRPPDLEPQLFLGLRLLVAARVETLGPLVVVFEDLHWADPASVELLRLLIQLTDLNPLLVLLTTRAEPDAAGWQILSDAHRHYAHRYTELRLERLSESESYELVRGLAGADALPQQVRDAVVDRCEGVPLFVEELVTALSERPVAAAVDEIQVPNTVRDVIGSRVARLPDEARGVLQAAAVLGRTFEEASLAAVASTPPQASLVKLLRAQIIEERPREGTRTYRFRSALGQQVVYESVPENLRAEAHARAAAHLAGLPAADWPELARHHEGAGAIADALAARLHAARLARSAPEAVSNFWRALGHMERLGDRSHEGEVLLELAALPGWRRTADESAQATRRLARAEQDADLATVAKLRSIRAGLAGDAELHRSALAVAREAGDDAAVAAASARYGDHLTARGRYGEAFEYITAAIEGFERLGRKREQALQMVIQGRCYAARSGLLEQSLDYASRASEIADELQDPILMAWRTMKSEPLMYLQRWSDVADVVEENMPLAWEIGAHSPIFFGSAWYAVALVRLGRLDDASAVLEKAIPVAETRGARFPLVYLYIAAAELAIALDDPERALDLSERACTIGADGGWVLDEGAAHRTRAAALAALDRQKEATEAHERSLALLEPIQAASELAFSRRAFAEFLATSDPARSQALLEAASEVGGGE